MADGAQLTISGVVTDGSSLSIDVEGVLVSHAVYTVTIQAADDSLPDGQYHLQLWDGLTLQASTDQPYAEYYASPSPPPFLEDSAAIEVVDGVGTGVLDTRTQRIEDQVSSRVRVSMVMTLYDAYHIYLPARTNVSLYRNEAGFYLGDFDLKNPENSIITGEKTFTEFPQTPSGDPVNPEDAANLQFVEGLLGGFSGVTDPLQVYANLSPVFIADDADISASDSKDKRILGIKNTTVAHSIVVSADNIKEGVELIFKDAAGNAALYPITVYVDGYAATIDGEQSVVINNNYGCMRVYSDGSNLYNMNNTVVIR